MLNIPELEQRWLRYKIKSTLPYVIISLSLVVISTTLYILLSDDSASKTEEKKSTPVATLTEENSSKLSEKNSSKLLKTVNQTVSTPKERVVVQKETEEQRVKLTPSMNFMEGMKNYVAPYSNHNALKQPKATPPKRVKKTEVVEIEPIEEEIVLESEQIVEEKPKKILIKRQNKQNDINEIIKRFKKNNNPALSLFIAKKYYELGNYHQSYNYALITNQINKEIEASWLIFAKSLVKLGKKDLAIRTLQEYVKSSHSGSAKILLNEIKSGKFE